MVTMMDEEDSQVPIWSYRVNLDKRINPFVVVALARKLEAHVPLRDTSPNCVRFSC